MIVSNKEEELPSSKDLKAQENYKMNVKESESFVRYHWYHTSTSFSTEKSVEMKGKDRISMHEFTTKVLDS